MSVFLLVSCVQRLGYVEIENFRKRFIFKKKKKIETEKRNGNTRETDVQSQQSRWKTI